MQARKASRRSSGDICPNGVSYSRRSLAATRSATAAMSPPFVCVVAHKIQTIVRLLVLHEASVNFKGKT